MQVNYGELCLLSHNFFPEYDSKTLKMSSTQFVETSVINHSQGLQNYARLRNLITQLSAHDSEKKKKQKHNGVNFQTF